MGDGLSGDNGLNVQKHVVRARRKEKEYVIILDLVERHALVFQ